MTAGSDTTGDALRVLNEATGVVIPVYFAGQASRAEGIALLSGTVAGFVRELGDPGAVCLSVDGTDTGEAAARAVAERFGVRVVVCDVNRGKLQAVRAGMACLLDETDSVYLAVVDQDGDHFANELLNLVRAACHIVDSTGDDALMILGRRISRHRPLGWLRGELEELADRVLLDALHYRAAVIDRPLRLEFATVLEEFPDFHSGYKLFSRRIATAVFTAPPNPCGVPDDGYYRHAVEAVMTVEALEAGARLGLVNRSTFDEQPISTFAQLNREQLVADKIIWPCKRLDVPGIFVDQWLRNHIPRLALGSLAPQGRNELKAIHGLVLDAFRDAGETTEAPFVRPRFV